MAGVKGGRMEFAGKTALVTGSGAIGGLGHATAKVLAAGGADLILTGSDVERGAQVVADIRATGDGSSARTVRFVVADLSYPATVRQLADDVGTVDILINNASVMTFAPTPGQDLASYDAAFAVNVRAPFQLTALLAEKMTAGGGSIVNISSTAAGLGMPGMAVYGATKAALESFTRTWAAEFAESNVRVNAVAPGPMRTSKVVAAMGSDLGGMGLTTALKRTSDPAEVAQVVAFLASDRASYMTGAIVAADGGRTAV